ncbi:putative RDD family membrane protein YckC [Mycolicibacterium iranicum]|uniref:Putative RDD family membrane protein YckC n=1 Tax=Mycolicibacterium iranicum TaxID=912594 RepID=A0A839QLZ5_MYCIR|nr:RDD family protein [Mycolicibacterium iranicum]MBB2993221.1 putative RDD family membrane protein YckC [Mycolicibacterium iranicum]
MTANPYTRWRTRVAASLIDAAPLVALWTVAGSVAIGAAPTECITYDNGGVACTAVHSPVGDIAGVVAAALTVAYLLWNFGRRQGVRGASIGKSVMGFRVVDQKTGQAVGFAASVLRQAVHLIDALPCGIGYLFPLWDPRRQTLADKLTGTVCVPNARLTGRR